MSLFGTYSYGYPLNWNASTLSYYMFWDALISAFGTFAGIIFLKKVLNLRDLAILTITVVALAGKLIIIGIAQ